MKPTSDKVFLDTNILVYAHTDVDANKQVVAQQLMVSEQKAFISTQVIQELANTLNKKFKISWNDIIIVLNDVVLNNTVHKNSDDTILQACAIASRYGFSFYDCLIISAALNSNCIILYSEDLNDGQIIENRLTIRNPFYKK